LHGCTALLCLANLNCAHNKHVHQISALTAQKRAQKQKNM
jgi:hypothetical protein